jgi:hypothetical protein
MNKKNRRWIILGGVLVIGIALLGRWMMMPRENADPVSATVETKAPVDIPPAAVQPAAVVQAGSEVRDAEGEATPEPAPPRALSLRGRVFDEDTGAPIADAHISAHFIRGSGRPRDVSRATSAADGQFLLEDLLAGRNWVSVATQDYAEKQFEVMVADNAGPLEIGLFVGGAITGRIVAPDGTTPVTGVVLITDDRGSSPTNTSIAGEFEARRLQPGRYQLHAQADVGMATREITLAKNQRVDDIILVMTAGHTIQGVVTGLRRNERDRIHVFWNREGDAGGGTAEVQIGDRVAFVIPGVIPGRVYLTAMSGSRQLSKMVEMPADSDLTVTLNFPRGARLSGRITRGGEPFPNVPVKPLPPGDAELPVSIKGTPTSMEGTYVIEDVPPGTYTLRIGSFQSGPIQISGDTVFDVDVPAGEISGRVVESDGEPIMNAQVFIWPAEPGEMQRPAPFPSDGMGNFTLSGLQPGEFTLTVYKPGFEMHRERVAFDANARDLMIRLREESGVEVRAREAAGGRPLNWLIAVEAIGAGRGTYLHLQLDDKGTGHIPSALAGSTLRFSCPGYDPTVVESWNGTKLDLQLERTAAR